MNSIGDKFGEIFGFTEDTVDTTPAKYLGAIFDCNLTWRPQLDAVVKKVSRKIGIRRRIGRNLNTSDSLRLFVQPCSMTLTTAHLCGALGQTLFADRLSRLEKRAVRAVAGLSFR